MFRVGDKKYRSRLPCRSNDFILEAGEDGKLP
jgi:hypothetical protein